MRTTDESKMLFCAQCDRGYHIYCLGLRNVPDGKFKNKTHFLKFYFNYNIEATCIGLLGAVTVFIYF